MKAYIFFILLFAANYCYAQSSIISPSSSVYAGFGSAIHIDHCTAIVGAPNSFACNGAVFIYQKENANWIQQQILRPEACSYFGNSVVINSKFAVVGSYNDTNNDETSSGSIYIYRNKGGEYVLMQKIIPEDLERGDQFGHSVTMTEEFIFVGTKGAGDKGLVYVFELVNDEWIINKKISPPEQSSNQLFGMTMDVSENFLAIGDMYGDKNKGSVLMYEIEDGEINYHSTLVASDQDDNDYYGFSLDLNKNQLIIGSLEDRDAAWECGAAYYYEYDGNKWREKQKIVPADGQKKDRFSWDVAINDHYLLIGATDHDGFQEDAGAVYSYSLNHDNWEFIKKFIPDDFGSRKGFGSAIFLVDNNYYIGAHGAVYTYESDHSSCSIISNTESITTSGFSISPNPARANVRINFDKNIEVKALCIYNINGQLLSISQVDHQDNIQINTESFKSGVYILQIRTKEKTMNELFVVE